ncbi:MAG: phenylalanine--tRNA ligase subunit beta [Erysipelotrichia bacterium]|nr:phenylalanine--tRNA ligase subunit beta [Erysipelotrichia bacterium]
MRVTYNWLKQYIDLNDTSPNELAQIMTKGGLEVETIEKQAYATNLIIGKVLSCVKHPNSDHLHICQVDIGDQQIQIVCGAPNVQVGQKVIVALPGCILPAGEIKAGKVRGEESNGMICALFELGVDKKQLSEEQLAGIEVLDENAPVGNRDVLAYLHLDDTIYDVSLTPNRADCMSMWALAKDVGALLNKKVILPDYSYTCPKKESTLHIKSETPKCSYFAGTIVNNLTIKQSPQWLIDALHAAGIKSINNVVDISNFVMLETGQPLHFYDLAKIPAREITVKTGLHEEYTALDGQKHQVLEDDIMITTEGKAIGYAGIMGGDDSKIDENTQGIIIEAAHFNGLNVRNTSRRLSLLTEAATRFSKGIDPQAAIKATERSIELLLKLADAKNVEQTVVFSNEEYNQTVIQSKVSKINKLLGTEFKYDDVFAVYERLDFAPKKIDDDTIETTIPSYRTDIKVYNDLAEEVIRVLGYENIVSTLPKMPTTQAHYSECGKEERIISSMLLGYGFNEVITYSLVSAEKNAENIFSIGTPVRIANAMGEDRRYYRTGLLPSMLDVISYNTNRGHNEYSLFEFANVYSDDGNDSIHLSLAMSKQSTVSKWQKIVEINDFYRLKGIILNILAKFGYDEKRVSFQKPKQENNILHPNKSAEIYLGRTLIGVMGHSHPQTEVKYNIDECILAELDIKRIFNEKPAKVKFVPINKYPSVKYDLALLVEEKITAEQIINTVKKAAGNLLSNVEIFDIYRGKGIMSGYKSVAISVIYRSNEKTLTEKDIAPVHSKVLDSLSRNLNATLRE